ncbi:MAG TPA: VIT and VWA domain-containing protein [Candidatus Methylacidiphilales bacterium]
MKTNILVLFLASLWSALSGRPLFADGFIVVTQPVHVPPGHFSFAPLEVSYHHVDVRIDGQICTTTVNEEFYNPNPQVLEGTYLFPIPKNAQIDKFTMQIGGKDVPAELLDAAKARAIYEDIVRRRLDPALMEYADRSVFKVRIFPIEGQGRKQVKITYTEILKADSGLISYTYPLNTEKFSSALIHDVSVKIDLAADQPLHSIYSPTHDVEIKHTDATHATIAYEAKEVRPDTDFQLFFAPEKSVVSLKMLTYQTGDDDGYFLLLAAPNLDMKSKPVPKDVAFVLDTSGSMADDNKLKQARKALQFCLANLNSDDRFEIIRFSTEPESLFETLTPADGKAVDRAQDFVSKLKPRGGTAIYDALGKAMALRPAKSERPFVVIFLTDGQPTVGETNDDAIVAETDKAANEGTRIFCFGLGTDVNAHLLDRIADHTHAASDYVLPSEDIEVKVSSFFGKIREPVLANVKLTFPDGMRVSKMYPQTMPDLFKGDQLVLTGRYNGNGSGTCALEGDADGAQQKFTAPVVFAKESTEQPFVPRLWASRRVAYLLDEIRLHGENPELKSEVTDLAREFGLVTPYTAYLIMEDEQQRGVASNNQIMSDFAKDKPAQESAGAAYNLMQKEKSGEGAVATARAQNTMKYAMIPGDALDKSNAEFARGMGVPSSVVTAGPRMLSASTAPISDSPDASTRLVQYTQQTKYLAGRAFYQNGNQWVDSRVSKQNGGKEVRLKFGSPEYFDFATQHPEARAYLSLGQNVKLVLANTVYDIFADSVPGSSSDKS